MAWGTAGDNLSRRGAAFLARPLGSICCALGHHLVGCLLKQKDVVVGELTA